MTTDEFLERYNNEILSDEDNKKIFFTDLIDSEENIYIPLLEKKSFKLFQITNLKTQKDRFFAILQNEINKNIFSIMEGINKPIIL